jgi:hypothetical protein
VSTTAKEAVGSKSPTGGGNGRHETGGGTPGRDYRIPANSPWAGAWKIAAGVGLLGAAISVWGFLTNPDRFPYSYLFGYFVSLSLALGSLFFVMVMYVTKASWGITVRRVAELLMRPMGMVFPLLVIPLVLQLPRLFPWMGAHHETRDVAAAEHQAPEKSAKSSPLEEARGLAAREPAALRDVPIASATRMEKAEDASEQKIVDHKRFFLNKWFFIIRLIGYLAIWSWLADRYYRWSTEQDKTKALENTASAQSFAPPALILWGLSLTFFAFDWLLSLNATWYSTIFGVYVFAQVALFQMASLILITLVLKNSGLLGDAVNVEHYHDMGKLLFGWIAFWSYIAFAQFFLTWYSNIPDEVAWYHQRWGDNGGTWKALSVAIVALHFFVPFWFLMSRNIKRRLPLLAAGALTMVVMHIVEVYWVIMPNYGKLEPSLMDLGCLLGVMGTYLAVVLYGMRDVSLIPVGDPRLMRALDFENA